MNEQIRFFRVTAAQFAGITLSEYVGAIFFLTDEGTIKVVGGPELANVETYGIDKEKIKNVSHADGSAELVFTMADGTEKKINIGIDEQTSNAIEALKGLLDENGNLDISLQYQSKMDDTTAVLNAIGGIKAGTTAAQLKTKTLSEVFDDILFPTLNPTIVAPAATLTLKSYAATVKMGTAGPGTANFTTGYNAGAININGAKKQDRAGAKTSDILYKGSETNVVGSFEDTIALGSNVYTYKVNYEAGPTPKDSKGNDTTKDASGNAITALPAGTLTKTVTVTGVYPYYTNSANNEAFAETLVPASGTTIEVQFVDENPNKHTIKIPYTVTNVQAWNTLSNAYEPFGIGKFTASTETIDVNGTDVEFNVYTRNDAGFSGPAKLKFTFTR